MANVVREWTERGSGEKTGREGVSHDCPGKMCKGQAQQRARLSMTGKGKTCKCLFTLSAKCFLSSHEELFWFSFII